MPTYHITLKFNKLQTFKKDLEAKDRVELDKLIESNKFLNANKDRITIEKKFK